MALVLTGATAMAMSFEDTARHLLYLPFDQVRVEYGAGHIGRVEYEAYQTIWWRAGVPDEIPTRYQRTQSPEIERLIVAMRSVWEHDHFMATTPEARCLYYNSAFNATLQMARKLSSERRPQFLANTLELQAKENWWRAKLAVWEQAVVGAHLLEQLALVRGERQAGDDDA